MRAFWSCSILLSLLSVAYAQVPNPAFGGKPNQISFHFGQSVRNGFEDLFVAALCYSQPNDFFRLPGRRNVEFITAHGLGKYSQYSQNLIFGLSQDVIIPAFWEAYAGANLGIYIKSQITDRINSLFTFGERIFIGISITDDIKLELYARHFSNGSLTDKNSGQNFIGFSTLWNFEAAEVRYSRSP